MDGQNLTVAYLLKYIKHEIRAIAAQPNARDNKRLGELALTLDIISDAAGLNVRQQGREFSRVIGIADDLIANIHDIGYGVEWKSTWPSDDEIEWLVLHELDRELKPPPFNPDAPPKESK